METSKNIEDKIEEQIDSRYQELTINNWKEKEIKALMEKLENVKNTKGEPGPVSGYILRNCCTIENKPHLARVFNVPKVHPDRDAEIIRQFETAKNDLYYSFLFEFARDNISMEIIDKLTLDK